MKGIKNMEINKQLFEDVLSGKLKGTFALRNGEIYSSINLYRNYNKFRDTNPYMMACGSYTPKGLFFIDGTSSYDIIDFIPDTNMKENELAIEIPNNKVVDWEESKKQNKIVLKDKQLTYKDICNKLFENKEFFFTNNTGVIQSSSPTSIEYLTNAANNSTSYHQLECILAKNQLANIAKYLNDGCNLNDDKYYYVIVYCKDVNKPHVEVIFKGSVTYGTYGLIVFKTKELAKQAIEILGEETVKLALEPLGI